MLTAPWHTTSTPASAGARADMQDNPLNLHEGMDMGIPEPTAFTHAAAEWISDADRTLFAQGSLATDPNAKDDAYKALAMSDQISSPLGLDAAQPMVVLADVRLQPPNQDIGYNIDEPLGDLPDMTAIIHALMLHNEIRPGFFLLGRSLCPGSCTILPRPLGAHHKDKNRCPCAISASSAHWPLGPTTQTEEETQAAG